MRTIGITSGGDTNPVDAQRLGENMLELKRSIENKAATYRHRQKFT